MSLRAEAAQARAFGFTLLAAEFAAKIAAAHQRYTGDELMAALAALHNEQRAAERALKARLTGEARDRRRRAEAARAPDNRPAPPAITGSGCSECGRCA